jgi:hypothetical protein
MLKNLRELLTHSSSHDISISTFVFKRLYCLMRKFFSISHVLEQVYCFVCSTDIVNYQKEIFFFLFCLSKFAFCCDKSDMGKSELFLFVNQEIQMILLTSL